MTVPITSSSLFDPRTRLALSMHAGPGSYALLVGSGISMAAGVETGWGVMKALVRKMAVVDGESPDKDFDAEAWWKNKYGSSLAYGPVVEASGATPAERRQILEEFFTPTDEERADGKKVPSAAHIAIAKLVARGSIRVIVTTNFDDLLEQAIITHGGGVVPQVASSPDMIDGLEPLHKRCTIIKVHGDYKHPEVLNTDTELYKYSDKLNHLLDQVFDEYGLLTCGWSATWDTALVAAINRSTSRRYPLYWTSYATLDINARTIVDNRTGTEISNVSAEEFFPDLVDRLELLDNMINPLLTRDLAIMRLKRCLPDPVRHIELRDLVDGEVQRIRSYLDERAEDPVQPIDWDSEVTALIEIATPLMDLLVHGIELDKRHDHDDLWVWVIEQMMKGYPRHFYKYGLSIPAWEKLALFPGYMVLKAASFAAVEIGRDDLLLRLHLDAVKPATSKHIIAKRDGTGLERKVPASFEFYDLTTIDGPLHTALTAKYTEGRFTYSLPVRAVLEPLLLPFVGDSTSFAKLAADTEFRVLLLQSISITGFSFAADHLCRGEHFDGEVWIPAEDWEATDQEETWISALDTSESVLALAVSRLTAKALEHKLW